MTTSLSARVENLAASRIARSISVDRSRRVCLNCAYYEQYYRRNRGNVAAWVPVDKGYCLKMEIDQDPLCKPCEKFETE